MQSTSFHETENRASLIISDFLIFKMGRILGKYSRFLLKLFILIQLYCYHNLEVDAVPSRHENGKTCDESHRHNGTTYFVEEIEKHLQRTKRPARMIPAKYLIKKEKNDTGNQDVKDKRFYGPASNCFDISKLGYTLNGYYLVKGKNQTKNDQVEVLGCRFNHPNGLKEAKEEKIGFIDIEKYKSKSVKRRSPEPFEKISFEAIENVDDDRSKRPARLLPLRMFLGKPKNNTDEHETETQFYGPASSCVELGKLGYTLNGLYLVDCEDKSQKGKIEVIECLFKQPRGSKEAKEERIGFVNIGVKKGKSVQRRQLNVLEETKSVVIRGSRNRIKRPIRLLPPHILYGNEKNQTEEKNVVSRFYGPPTTCSDLGKLGYTLNGYYLVKDDGADSIHIAISLCRFRQRIVGNETLKEERFSLVKSTTTIKPATTTVKALTTTKTTSTESQQKSLFEERFRNCSGPGAGANFSISPKGLIPPVHKALYSSIFSVLRGGSSPAAPVIQPINCDVYPILKKSWSYSGSMLCYVSSMKEKDYHKKIYKCLKSATWFGAQQQNYYIIIGFIRVPGATMGDQALGVELSYEGGIPSPAGSYSFYCLAFIRDSAEICLNRPVSWD